MNVREKMARAMYESDVATLTIYRTMSREEVPREEWFELRWGEQRGIYLRRADACLDALMEPTPEIIVAGSAAMGTLGTSVEDFYRAMIRAAKDGK